MIVINIKLLFTRSLILFTVLYYFIRFQTGYVSEFASLQVFLLTSAGVFGLLSLIKNKLHLDLRSFLTSPDFIFLVLVFHGALFSLFVFYRDGYSAFFYSGLHAILPFVIYYYFSKSFHFKEIVHLVLFIELIFLSVAVLYISEFLSRFFFMTGSMAYSVALDDYVINQIGNEGGVSKSWVNGDNITWVRFAGPLSHVNTTGLAIALGMVISFGRFYLMKKKIEVAIFFIFLIALLMTGGRTSVFSGFIGLICILILSHGFLLSIKTVLKLAFFSFPFIIILGYLLVEYQVIDISAFSQIYNFDNSGKTLNVMFTKSTFELYFEQIVNNPVTLITGLGYPSKDVSLYGWGSSIADDDVFFISLLSRYGVVIPVLFISFLVGFGRLIRRQIIRSNGIILDMIFIQIILLSFVITALVSTVHTDALFRPQILPIVVIVISFIVLIQRTMQKGYAKIIF